jgi:hypothetical protein
MIRRFALSAALTVAFGPAAFAQQPTWVAIASDGAGLWGLAVGMADREAAEQEGFGAGPTRPDVEQQAWAECNANVPANSCRVQSARCFE